MLLNLLQMALTFLLAAKQIGKCRVDFKRIQQINSKFKQKQIVKNINVFRPQQIASKCRPSEAISGKHIECIEIFVRRRRFHAVRHYSNGSGNASASETPPLPRILYLQNPFTWIVNRFDLKVLEKAWDPTFNHNEFIKGSKQAVCTVTQLLREGRAEDLAGLLTRTARGSLQLDLQQPGAEKVVPLLALEPPNIRVAAPRRVRFLKYEDRKFCDVDMMFVALKWMPSRDDLPDADGMPSRDSLPYEDGLIYVEIFASFRREYTRHSIPEWTISYFKIIKFSILDR